MHQMSRSYPSPAPTAPHPADHHPAMSSAVLTPPLLHSVLRFIPGTFAWILQEVRQSITVVLMTLIALRFFLNLLSNDIFHLVVDQS